MGNRIILTLIMSLLFILNLVGCTSQVTQNQIDTQGMKNIEELSKQDLIFLFRKVGIETVILPDFSGKTSYTDIQVIGETIRFKYKNITFIESEKDLKAEEIIEGGIIVQEKQVLLDNGVKAKWILVSNHKDNVEEASAGLYLSNYGTNIAILVESMELNKEIETQEIAEGLYYIHN